MRRDDMLARVVARDRPWDFLVIGGGATGVGIAVDAASRGYDVLLLERSDFGKGTSSRSTKLAHGGVRYLERGNVSLVMEALRERGLLRRNAPHLVSDLAFVVPGYAWWEVPFYGLGLKLYSVLAGKHGFGPTEILTKDETLERLPTIRAEGLRGGVLYHDGQFDDARLLVHLVATAAEHGATLLNYAPVVALTRDARGTVDGAALRDLESGRELHVHARVVVNATGAFCDGVRRLAEPAAVPLVTASQGIHLVLDGSFLPRDHALMIPRTSDGRVLFAIPWGGRTLVGTTDTPVEEAVEEPRPLSDEIAFVLETAGLYLKHPPARSDVRSVFAGVRPLVRSAHARNTAALSRDHTIHVDRSGLLTITGGKWTTYRNMAEDCVNQAARLGHLPAAPCTTRAMRVHGYHEHAEAFGPLSPHGADAPRIRELAEADPPLAERLHAAFETIGAEVVWAVREEMARTVEDVLARRTRALFLDARAAIAMAPRVSALMARELGRDPAWAVAQVAAFEALAAAYVLAA